MGDVMGIDVFAQPRLRARGSGDDFHSHFWAVSTTTNAHKENMILEHKASVLCGSSVKVPTLSNNVALKPGDWLAVLPFAAVKKRKMRARSLVAPTQFGATRWWL